MLITKVPPHIFLCVLEVSWASLTFGASGVTKAGHLYLIRFLVGLLEVGHLTHRFIRLLTLKGGYFPCVMWICGSWYNRSELAKRTVLIQVASSECWHSARATDLTGNQLPAVCSADTFRRQRTTGSMVERVARGGNGASSCRSFLKHWGLP